MTTGKKKSKFITQDSVPDDHYIDTFGAGVNRKIPKPKLFKQIRDEAQTFIYPTVEKLQQANLEADPDNPVYVRVAENNFYLYTITSLEPGPDDIELDNGTTATFQQERIPDADEIPYDGEIPEDNVESALDYVADELNERVTSLSDITALDSLDTSVLLDGQQFSVAKFGPDYGGLPFLLKWDSSIPKSRHNGVTIFSNTVPYGPNPPYREGSGEADPSGEGCFALISDYIDAPIVWDIYVDSSSGDDSNRGSQEEPLESVQAAVSLLPTVIPDGQTIRIFLTNGEHEGVEVSSIRAYGELVISGTGDNIEDCKVEAVVFSDVWGNSELRNMEIVTARGQNAATYNRCRGRHSILDVNSDGVLPVDNEGNPLDWDDINWNSGGGDDQIDDGRGVIGREGSNLNIRRCRFRYRRYGIRGSYSGTNVEVRDCELDRNSFNFASRFSAKLGFRDCSLTNPGISNTDATSGGVLVGDQGLDAVSGQTTTTEYRIQYTGSGGGFPDTLSSGDQVIARFGLLSDPSPVMLSIEYMGHTGSTTADYIREVRFLQVDQRTAPSTNTVEYGSSTDFESGISGTDIELSDSNIDYFEYTITVPTDTVGFARWGFIFKVDVFRDVDAPELLDAIYEPASA